VEYFLGHPLSHVVNIWTFLCVKRQKVFSKIKKKKQRRDKTTPKHKNIAQRVKNLVQKPCYMVKKDSESDLIIFQAVLLLFKNNICVSTFHSTSTKCRIIIEVGTVWEFQFNFWKVLRSSKFFLTSQSFIVSLKYRKMSSLLLCYTNCLSGVTDVANYLTFKPTHHCWLMWRAITLKRLCAWTRSSYGVLVILSCERNFLRKLLLKPAMNSSSDKVSWNYLGLIWNSLFHKYVAL